MITGMARALAARMNKYSTLPAGITFRETSAPHKGLYGALFALLAGLGAIGCGGADAKGVAVAGDVPEGSLEPQGGLNIPQCFAPAKLTCTATGCRCVSPPPPPPVQQFQLIPDFYITNVIYAPPGKSSSINYASSTTTGSTTSATHGLKDDVKVTAEASGSFFGGASVNMSAGISDNTSRTDTLDISESFSQGYKKSGQVDRIDHNYDEIWFLIHPNISVSFQPAYSTNKASVSWKFAGGDGFNTDILHVIYAWEFHDKNVKMWTRVVVDCQSASCMANAGYQEWLYVKGPKFSVGLDGWAAPTVGFKVGSNFCPIFGTMKVLIIEDNQELARNVRDFLGREGYVC